MKESENKLQQNNQEIDTWRNQMFQQDSKTDIQKSEGNKWTIVDVAGYATVIGFVLVFLLTCLNTCDGKIPSALEDNDYGYYMMTKNNIPDITIQHLKYKAERNKTAQFYDAYNRTRAMKYKPVATNTR